MKLIDFIYPTIKAILAVIGIILGMGWGAYEAVSHIAKAEASLVRNEIIVIRSLDMEHLNKRFDRLERILQERK